MGRPATIPPLDPSLLSYTPRLGHELRNFRRALQLTQGEVAKRIGVSQRVLSRWENNRVADLDGRTLIRLGTLYGLSPNAIARMAGWWAPNRPEDAQSSPKWEYVLNFLNNPATSDTARERFYELAYATCRAVESLEESGTLRHLSSV